MEQNKKSIEREIKRMQKYLETGEGCPITQRMVYSMSEVLRWSIEDTVGWENPLQQATSNAKILRDEVLR